MSSLVCLIAQIFLATVLFDGFVAGDQLLMVNVLWRHGDRTPRNSFPKDPNMNYWMKQGFGQLTSIGAQQHQAVGAWLRDRYVNDLKFLPETYNSSLIYVRSTDYQRTQESAKNNMIGMYNYVPPIRVVSAKSDYMLQPQSSCRRAAQLRALVPKSGTWKRYANKRKSLLNTLTKLTGRTQSLDNIDKLADTIRINLLKGRKVSSQLKSLFPRIEGMEDWQILMLYGFVMGTYKGDNFKIEIPRAMGGNMLKTFIDRMRDRVNGGQDTTKYFAYSGHDGNIISLLSTFGFSYYDYNRNELPAYASYVLVELWQRSSDNVPYVKVIYRGEGGLYDISGQIKGCPSNGCTLDQFHQRSLPYLMSDYNKFCNTKPRAW